MKKVSIITRGSSQASVNIERGGNSFMNIYISPTLPIEIMFALAFFAAIILVLVSCARYKEAKQNNEEHALYFYLLRLASFCVFFAIIIAILTIAENYVPMCH